jgi:hypothetical protein
VIRGSFATLFLSTVNSTSQIETTFQHVSGKMERCEVNTNREGLPIARLKVAQGHDALGALDGGRPDFKRFLSMNVALDA